MLDIESLSFWCCTLKHNLNQQQVQESFAVQDWLHANRQEALKWAAYHQVLLLLEHLYATYPQLRINEIKYLAAENKLETIKWVCQQSSSKINQSNKNVALEQASKNGHLGIVQYLIEQKADARARDQAITSASQKGRLEIVHYLIHQGVSVRAKNWALQCASEKGHLNIVHFLVNSKVDFTENDNYAMQWASGNGHLDVVRFLVEQKAGFLDRALLMASESGHLDTLKFLVDQKADVTTDSNYALRWASRNGHLEVVKFLVYQKADVNDDRAIYYARNSGFGDIVRFLMEHKQMSLGPGNT